MAALGLISGIEDFSSAKRVYDSVECRLYKGLARINNGEYDKAITSLDKSLTLLPKSELSVIDQDRRDTILCAKGDVHILQGQISDGFNHYKDTTLWTNHPAMVRSGATLQKAFQQLSYELQTARSNFKECTEGHLNHETDLKEYERKLTRSNTILASQNRVLNVARRTITIFKQEHPDIDEKTGLISHENSAAGISNMPGAMTPIRCTSSRGVQGMPMGSHTGSAASLALR